VPSVRQQVAKRLVLMRSQHNGKEPSEYRNRNCRQKAGFRQGKGMRDQITNFLILMHKARKYQQPLCMCFVDLKKSFDSTRSHMMSCGWLWWTWDILCTSLTCWPNC